MAASLLKPLQVKTISLSIFNTSDGGKDASRPPYML